VKRHPSPLDQVERRKIYLRRIFERVNRGISWSAVIEGEAMDNIMGHLNKVLARNHFEPDALLVKRMVLFAINQTWEPDLINQN
jgi:hypothetical protein